MIEIYRFGRYVNTVSDEEELREWIIKNVPYDRGVGRIPDTTPTDVCCKLAIKKDYSFRTKTE